MKKYQVDATINVEAVDEDSAQSLIREILGLNGDPLAGLEPSAKIIDSSYGEIKEVNE